jgi:hypothetical protein
MISPVMYVFCGGRPTYMARYAESILEDHYRGGDLIPLKGLVADLTRIGYNPLVTSGGWPSMHIERSFLLRTGDETQPQI